MNHRFQLLVSHLLGSIRFTVYPFMVQSFLRVELFIRIDGLPTQPWHQNTGSTSISICCYLEPNEEDYSKSRVGVFDDILGSKGKEGGLVFEGWFFALYYFFPLFSCNPHRIFGALRISFTVHDLCQLSTMCNLSTECEIAIHPLSLQILTSVGPWLYNLVLDSSLSWLHSGLFFYNGMLGSCLHAVQSTWRRKEYEALRGYDSYVLKRRNTMLVCLMFHCVNVRYL